jgi:hypothetical protein
MAKASSKGGKTTKLENAGAGGPVDDSQYAQEGQVLGAAYAQPFWDIEAYASDSTGRPLGTDGPLFSSNQWEVVQINGKNLPGIWVATATPSLQLDVQKPNGYDGAALVQKGYVPAGITMTGTIWTPEQWALFQVMIPTFWRNPNKWAVNDVKKQKAQIEGKQRSLAIYYPGIAPFAINEMVIYQITPPESTDQPGVKQIKLLARQYIPVPQRQQSAEKKTEGRSGQDRTVQAQQIYADNTADLVAANAKLPGQSVQIYPAVSNAPLPPSQAQAGAKLPSIPAFLRRPD